MLKAEANSSWLMRSGHSPVGVKQNSKTGTTLTLHRSDKTTQASLHLICKDHHLITLTPVVIKATHK